MLLLAMCFAGSAAEMPQSRRILALYNGIHEPEESDTMIYACAEVIFDHLGLVLDYRDVNLPLPSHEEMARYRGIFTWFLEGQMADPEGYCKWLLEESRSGRYVVVFGNIGAFYDLHGEMVREPAIRPLFEQWGFDYQPVGMINVFDASVVDIDMDYFGFERAFLLDAPPYDQYTPLPDAGVQTLLSIKLGHMDFPPSSMVTIHRNGGFALQSYCIYQAKNFRRQ